MLDVISILCVLAEKRGSGMGSNQVPISSIYGRMSAFGSRRAAVTASTLFAISETNLSIYCILDVRGSCDDLYFLTSTRAFCLSVVRKGCDGYCTA